MAAAVLTHGVVVTFIASFQPGSFTREGWQIFVVIALNLARQGLGAAFANAVNSTVFSSLDKARVLSNTKWGTIWQICSKHEVTWTEYICGCATRHRGSYW